MVARYCSKKCQIAGWSEQHKPYCRKYTQISKPKLLNSVIFRPELSNEFNNFNVTDSFKEQTDEKVEEYLDNKIHHTVTEVVELISYFNPSDKAIFVFVGTMIEEELKNKTIGENIDFSDILPPSGDP